MVITESRPIIGSLEEKVSINSCQFPLSIQVISLLEFSRLLSSLFDELFTEDSTLLIRQAGWIEELHMRLIFCQALVFGQLLVWNAERTVFSDLQKDSETLLRRYLVLRQQQAIST